MRLIIIRHAETDLNRSRRIQGAYESNISENGKKQALQVGSRIRNMKFSKILVSPLKRAIQTAEILSRQSHKNIEIREELHEMKFGDWEGMTFPDIAIKYPHSYEKWNSQPTSCTIEGDSDRLIDVAERINIFVEELKADHFDENFVIITHTIPAKLLFMNALGLDLNKIHSIRVDNASMNIVDYMEDRSTLTLLNDISHLRNLNKWKKQK